MGRWTLAREASACRLRRVAPLTRRQAGPSLGTSKQLPPRLLPRPVALPMENRDVAAEARLADAAVEKATAENFELGMRVQRRFGTDKWGEGFVTSLEPLQVTMMCDPDAPGLVFDEVRPLPEQRRRELEAHAAMLTRLRVGMRVQRRFTGMRWGEGFVTSVEPLLVTHNCDDPSATGCEYDEVQPLSEERTREIEAQVAAACSHVAALTSLAAAFISVIRCLCCRRKWRLSCRSG